MRQSANSTDDCMEKQFDPTNNLFSGFDNLDKYRSLSVSLGVNPAYAREVEGDGLPCVVTPAYKAGGFAGTGGHPGFCVAFPIDSLRAAGFPEEAIEEALGCNWGVYQDHQHDNQPV